MMKNDHSTWMSPFMCFTHSECVSLNGKRWAESFHFTASQVSMEGSARADQWEWPVLPVQLWDPGLVSVHCAGGPLWPLNEHQPVSLMWDCSTYWGRIVGLGEEPHITSHSLPSMSCHSNINWFGSYICFILHTIGTWQDYSTTISLLSGHSDLFEICLAYLPTSTCPALPAPLYLPSSPLCVFLPTRPLGESVTSSPSGLLQQLGKSSFNMINVNCDEPS